MNQETAQGLAVEPREDTADTNEEFTGAVSRLDADRRESGWDPFEVWRTRVRGVAKGSRTRKDRDPQR